jgi:hypothetical protein
MKRNKFSLANYRLQSMNAGELVPINWEMINPTDSIQARTTALVRAAPLVAPIMHPIAVRIHHWFVPIRLLWTNFPDFITGGEDGMDSTSHPTVTFAANLAEGTLGDYLGIPSLNFTTTNITVNALPFRAYQMIWNHHYRDQRLQTEQTVSLGDGNDTTTGLTAIKRVCWEKDYFTTATEEEQLGAEVTIPLLDEAPVESTGSGAPLFTVPGGVGESGLWSASSGKTVEWDTASSGAGIATWSDPKLVADLSAATGISVNDLRLALAQQRFKEARAMFGTRYVEYLKYLGVRNPDDARLQNPEYIAGGRNVIGVSEVLSTDGANTGQMKGHGISAMRTNRFRRYFQEHGIFMTLMSIVPKAVYADALGRKWLMETRDDYYQKENIYLGDQEIKNVEVQADHATPDGTFGFQGRYDHLRFSHSSIAGKFAGDLDHWHMARVWDGNVALNSDMVECDPTTRVFQDEAGDQFNVMINNSVQARRQLPRNPRPRVI